MPLAIDQFFWGERNQKLGIGLSIPQRKLNAENLAQAINETLNNKEMSTKAKVISNALNKEDGIKSAVTQIRKLL